MFMGGHGMGETCGMLVFLSMCILGIKLKLSEMVPHNHLLRHCTGNKYRFHIVISK